MNTAGPLPVVWLLKQCQRGQLPGAYTSARAAMIALDMEIRAGWWDSLWSWPSHWKRPEPQPSAAIAGRALCRWFPKDPTNLDGVWVMEVPDWNSMGGFTLTPVVPMGEAEVIADRATP